MANAEHVELLKNDVVKWNIWRANNLEMLPNLYGTDLYGANLRQADLSQANLSRADLSGADLSRAFLAKTVFAMQDLTTLQHLEAIRHRAPSFIYLPTVTLPRMSAELATFLRGTGQSEYLIEALIGTELPLGNITIKLFLSFAEADQALFQGLHHHLSLLERAGGIVLTYEAVSASAHEAWQSNVQAALEETHLLVILVSAPFLASPHVWQQILEPALKHQEEQGMVLVPVILRSVAWQDGLLGSLQPLPALGKPVSEWADHDAAFLDIVKGLRQTVRELHTRLMAEAARKRARDLLLARLIQTRTELAEKHTALDTQDSAVQQAASAFQEAEKRLQEARQTLEAETRKSQELQDTLSTLEGARTALHTQLQEIDAAPGNEEG